MNKEAEFWCYLWVITFIVLLTLFFLEQYFNQQAVENLLREYNITIESTTRPPYNPVSTTRPTETTVN